MLQQQIRMNTFSISHWNHLHFSTDLHHVHLGDGDCRAHSWVVQSKIQREQSHRPHMTVLNIQVCREYISLYNSIFKFHNFIVHKTSNFLFRCAVSLRIQLRVSLLIRSYMLSIVQRIQYCYTEYHDCNRTK